MTGSAYAITGPESIPKTLVTFGIQHDQPRLDLAPLKPSEIGTNPNLYPSTLEGSIYQACQTGVSSIRKAFNSVSQPFRNRPNAQFCE
jgi:hypothetical protein